MGEATDEDGRRVLYTGYLEALGAWRDFVGSEWDSIGEEPFALFLACDATLIPTEVIAEFASWCIDRGVFWVSTWGPDCERVHDIFDEVDVGEGGATSRPVVMTSWHDNEALDEAAVLFWWAFPDRGKPGGPHRVALAVGRPDWDRALQRIARHHLNATGDRP
jgi:hypothetical protein